MSKGIYPIIAVLKFRSKHIKVNLPLRIRYFKLMGYACEQCKSKGTLKDIISYYKQEHKYLRKYNKKTTPLEPEGIEMYDIKINDRYLSCPKKIVKNLNTIYCPKCYLKENQEVLMSPNNKDMYCMYCCTSPRFVNVMQIIDFHLAGRWKDLSWRPDKSKPTSYFKRIDEAYRIVDRLKNTPSKKRTLKGYKLMVKVNEGITEKELKGLYKEYLLKKLAKKI
jgi:hypothetical protein